MACSLNFGAGTQTPVQDSGFPPPWDLGKRAFSQGWRKADLEQCVSDVWA